MTIEDRFVERLKRVMQIAQQHARRLNHEYLGTEHILLGLIDEPNGLAAGVIRDVSDLASVRRAVLEAVTPGPPMVTIGRLPRTPRAKLTLEHAAAAADRLGHRYLNTEHMLLGLLSDEGSFAEMTLRQHGITLAIAEERLVALLGLPDDPAGVLSLQHVQRLLVRCADSLGAMPAASESEDLILAQEGVLQAIRWTSEYRGKQCTTEASTEDTEP